MSDPALDDDATWRNMLPVPDAHNIPVPDAFTWKFGIHKATPFSQAVGLVDNRHCGVCGWRIKSVMGGWGPTWVHSDTGTVAAPNPPCYQPEGGTWQLVQGERGIPDPAHVKPKVLAVGTEQEVKGAAQLQVDDAHMRYHREHEAQLRSDLYLVKPDGSYQRQKYDAAGFVPGERIEWVDVDW